MNKIFISKRMNKNNINSKYSKVLSLGYDKIDYEKDKNLKLLENLFSLKLNQDYIDKSSLLLYNSKKTKNYPLKRLNLKKTVYNYDENNNLFITFPKFNLVGKNLKEKKFNTIESLPKTKNYFITDKNNLDDESENIEDLRQKINEEIGYNNPKFKTISNNEDIENDEIKNKGEKLYKLLKTNYGKSLPKIENRNTDKEEYLFIKRITDIDPILGNKIYNNKFRYLTKKQRLNLLYLSELDVFNSLNVINSKKEILNKIKKMDNNNIIKNNLLIKDLFYYDKNKWKKFNQNKNFDENKEKINEFNEKNKKKLLHLKNIVDKLENEKLKTEIDVQETISNIELFLQKNSSSLMLNNIRDKSTRGSRIKKK